MTAEKPTMYRATRGGDNIRHIERSANRNTVWCGVEGTDWTAGTDMKTCKKCEIAHDRHQEVGLP